MKDLVGLARRHLKSSAIVSATLLGSSAMVFIRDATIAYRFGRSETVDALLLALIPVNQLSLIVGPVLLPMLVPYFVRDAAEGESGFLRKCLAVTAAVGVLLALMLSLLGPQLVLHLGHRLSAAALQSSVEQMRFLSVVIIVTAISNVFWAVLIARKHLVLPNLGAAVPSLLAVLLLLFGSSTLGIWSVGIGMLTGSLLMCATGCIAVARVDPLLFSPGRQARQPGSANIPVMKLCALAAGTSSASIAGNLAEQGFAMRIGAGSVSTINFANRVPTLLYSIGAAITSSVLLPRFAQSRTVGSRTNWQEYRQFATLAFLAFAVLSLCICAVSPQVTELIFGRGRFSSGDALIVGAVQRVYVLSPPFWIAGLVGARMLQANGANRAILWITVMQYAVDFAVCWVMTPLLGAVGIALGYLAMSIAYLAMISLAVARLPPRRLASEPGAG